MKILHLDPVYTIAWNVETEYCHHGIPLSNGIFGALVWFQDHTIMITINRADYWDHRGGTVWTEACSYSKLKELLLSGDFETAKHLYSPITINGKEKRPTRLPMGRYEIKLKEGIRIVSAELNLYDAEATIRCLVNGDIQTIKLTILTDHPVLVLSIEQELIETLEARPSYDFPKVKAYYDDFGIAPHQLIELSYSKGWVQELPEDPACAVLAEWEEGILRIAADYGESAEEASQAVKHQLDLSNSGGYVKWIASSRKVWNELWDQAADISLPDREIETMYYLGIFRMLGNSMPGGIAPTLQGPWAEEFRMPPWSCDYHFNINVQECLWPAYGSNMLPSLKPLFEMIEKWKPTLERNAKQFVGIEDGYMLNHSTDDRGRPIGGMWTGTIDHANTSWVAQMMWQYYTYSFDEDYLLNEVYPFMKKTLNVFIAMMDRDGEAYALPVSVSPEYGGSSSEALGKNSTFFLVNVHFLCEKIMETIQKCQFDSSYAKIVLDVQKKLPPFTTGPRQLQEFNRKDIAWPEELYLWENQPLTVCHRHHSHLAGIYPFDTIDLTDAYNKEVVEHSYRTWIDKGMGRWAGWSMPWASILHNRLGNPDMALLTLKMLQEVYMMPGYATRHNANYDGFCQFYGGDVMQVEASIAASAAVLEMFVQCIRGSIHVFKGLAKRFKNAAFSGIRAEGAFLLSGKKADGDIQYISVFSEKGSDLKIFNPFSGMAFIHRNGEVTATEMRMIELATEAAETIILSRSADLLIDTVL